VHELLTAIYGECRTHCQFPWQAQPQIYTDTLLGNTLQQIREALADLRGHRDFIKSAQMPPCDYFIAAPPFIVEFDESQHFSRPRSVALANYPQQITVGFSISRWQDLCREINAVDDTPIDRDERRLVRHPARFTAADTRISADSAALCRRFGILRSQCAENR